MSKYTAAERRIVRSIIASLSIKRVPEPEILSEVFRQTNKTLSHAGLYCIKQAIKRESYYWYKTMREGEYEYIHEFRERISEIMSLQKKHYEIIDNNEDNPTIQQTSLAELHRLSITLSNLYDVAPTIIGVGPNATISITPETRAAQAQAQTQQGTLSFSQLDKLRGLPFWIWNQEEHLALARETNGQCCFNHVVGLPQKDKVELIMKRFFMIL